MLKRFFSAAFSVLMFFAFYQVSNSTGYAQASMTGADIVQGYKTNRLTIPKSEIQYREVLALENERFEDALDAIKEIYRQDAQTLAGQKKGCGTNLRCIRYFNEEGRELYNNSVKDQQNLKEIYRQRRTQIEAARKNFQKMEMRIDPGLTQPTRQNRPIRIYERRVDDRIIRQNRN